mgnify:FL=1
MPEPKYQAGTYVVVKGRPFYSLRPNEGFYGIVTGSIESWVGGLNRETKKMEKTRTFVVYRVMLDDGNLERLVHETDINPLEPSTLPLTIKLTLENHYRELSKYLTPTGLRLPRRIKKPRLLKVHNKVMYNLE